MALSASLLIRRVTASDAEDVATILSAAFAEYRSLYTPAAFAATVISAGEARARIRSGTTWLASIGGRSIGTVSAVPKDDGIYVRSMAVTPEARGQGVARALLAAVEAYARRRGVRRMYLSTTPFLDGAIGLYGAFGFRVSDEGPSTLHGTPLFTMEKRIEASRLDGDDGVEPRPDTSRETPR